MKSKTVNWLFYVILVISIVTIGYFIFLGYAYNTYPFPERTKVSEMTQDMKDSGEGILLISMVVAGGVFLPLYIICIILAAILSYKLLWNYKKEEQDQYKKKSSNILWIIYSVFFILFPIIFIYGMFYPLYKFKNQNSYDSLSFRKRRRFLKDKKIWKSIAITTPILAYSIPLMSIGIIEATKPKVAMQVSKLKNAYTLSRNKPNTIILYFDRGHGLYFNEMLAIDYLFFNKENGLINKDGTSLVELFPEFTSYINSLSAALVTNCSNPTINASWFDLPIFKQMKLLNGVNGNIVNKDLTMNQWFLNSYLFNFNLFEKYGYENYSLINPPYYGNRTYQCNANCNEMQSDFTKTSPDKNVICMDTIDISHTLTKQYYNLETSEAVELRQLFSHENSIGSIKSNPNKLFPDDLNTNPKYLNNKYGNNVLLDDGVENNINVSVSETKDSTLLFNHSQVTHQDYTYYYDDSYKSSYNPNGINYDNPSDGKLKLLGSEWEEQLPSMWYMVQKLKDTFLYLKNLPYTGPNSDIIKNQYDNCNIYVISDHGNSIGNTKKAKLHIQMLNFLKSNNVLTKEMYDELINYLDGRRSPVMDCMLFRKPRKFINDSLNKRPIVNKPIDKLYNIYDWQHLLTLPDLLPIIETDLELVKKDINHDANLGFDKSKSYFNIDSYYRLNKNIIPKDKEVLDNFFKNNLIIDPLSDATKTWNRLIPAIAAEWRYFAQNKEYKKFHSFAVFDGKPIMNNDSLLKRNIYMSSQYYPK